MLASADVRAGVFTLAGLVLAALVALVVFVGPNWREYWFYNWQISVVRKPGYTLKDFFDRVTWLPILHDFFTRMWLVATVAVVYAIGRVVRWRSAGQGERLLMSWLAVGIVELVVHDVGNERRLVFLVPAMAGLAAIALGSEGRLLPTGLDRIPRPVAALVAPGIFYACYIVFGAIVRLPWIHEIRPGVRASALVALLATAALYAWWRPAVRWLAHPFPAAVGLSLAGLVMIGDLVQFAQWAAGRTYRNYEAMRIVAERLPPGTLVQGKLANGMSLESRIRPVFVGRGFGNYADRLQRDDIKYVLAYVSPRLGYDGPIIAEVLEAYPRRRVLWTVPVAETTCDCDRAALFEKSP
jgi:hypothetical protein